MKLSLKHSFEYCIVFQKELAKAITLEQGKTLADAEGDVFRGLRKFISLTCALRDLYKEQHIEISKHYMLSSLLLCGSRNG